jgi:hypothetical protein
VLVALPIDLPARIVDDQGLVVAQAGQGLNKEMTFYPRAGHHSNLPGPMPRRVYSEGAFQHQTYYLQLYVADLMEPGVDYPVTIEVINETGPEYDYRVYLPLATRSSP